MTVAITTARGPSPSSPSPDHDPTPPERGTHYHWWRDSKLLPCPRGKRVPAYLSGSNSYPYIYDVPLGGGKALVMRFWSSFNVDCPVFLKHTFGTPKCPGFRKKANHDNNFK
ncbi:hypothetical protein AVEN_174736-1 [Araneus ventricosus]|uniref:Uncharacterized protein n=1 Tax=Araneus ventricosus TaxID=182803 RepID=A0A4Y2BJL7_ARAVE|nr:hypothetical protein AVEN_174736-1 [Araneus ventricosus]